MDDVVGFHVSRRTLKRVVLGAGLLAMGYLAGAARAQVPADAEALNYRGFLVANGTPVDGPRPVAVEIFNVEPLNTGSPVCRADPPGDTTISRGWFTVPMGAGCATALRGAGPFFVEVQVDGSTVGQRTRLGAVPFALEAASTPVAAALSPRTAVRAYRATIQNIMPGDAVAFDAEQFDNLGEYNAATGIFTASQGGVYQVTCALGFNGTTVNNFNLDVEAAGVVQAQVWRGEQGGALQLHVSTVVMLTQGQTAACRASNGTGAAMDVAGSNPWDAGRNFISIVRVD